MTVSFQVKTTQSLICFLKIKQLEKNANKSIQNHCIYNICCNSHLNHNFTMNMSIPASMIKYKLHIN